MSAEPQSPGPQQKSAQAQPPSQQKRILIVDDEEGLRSLCATFLQRRGYAVTTCADGAAAWAELSSASPAYNLLITDNAMPRLDGAQLIERVRAAKMLIRILSISGSHPPEQSQPTVSDVDGVVPKPFTIQDLGAAVRAQLGG